jgi:hypothetical protein
VQRSRVHHSVQRSPLGAAFTLYSLPREGVTFTAESTAESIAESTTEPVAVHTCYAATSM